MHVVFRKVHSPMSEPIVDLQRNSFRLMQQQEKFAAKAILSSHDKSKRLTATVRLHLGLVEH